MACTTCYSPVLHVTVPYYMLQSRTTCYSTVLHVTAAYYMLQVPYYMLQSRTTCYSTVLHVTAAYYSVTHVLHVTAPFCMLQSRTTVMLLPLTPNSTQRACNDIRNAPRNPGPKSHSERALNTLGARCEFSQNSVRVANVLKLLASCPKTFATRSEITFRARTEYIGSAL